MPWLLAVFVSLVVITLLLLFSSIRYRITAEHLEVRLFGLRLRRVALSDIRYVSTRRTKLAEKWVNTLKTSHRELVIHRRSGLLKNFVITPRRRYVFKAQLDRAIENCRSGSGSSDRVPNAG